MSAHVKVWHNRVHLFPAGTWFASCVEPTCRGWLDLEDLFPTHAEALAAAWAHIKEHS